MPTPSTSHWAIAIGATSLATAAIRISIGDNDGGRVALIHALHLLVNVAILHIPAAILPGGTYYVLLRMQPVLIRRRMPGPWQHSHRQ